jgi:di/tricarboxylate transporter
MAHNDWKYYAKEIPILGGLVDCDGRDHWESFGQTSVLFLLSSMPIWLGTLIVYATGEEIGYLGFKMAFFSTINRGELFMYSTAFLAPIFWIALTDRPGMRVFPGKVSHIVLMVVISVIAAVFFGLLVAGNRLNQRFTLDLSTVMFITSLVLLYLGILYHESRIKDAGSEMKRDEQSFSAKVHEHRNEP